MVKKNKARFCFLFVLILILSSIFSVQYVNAELGHPTLKISSVVTPNEIQRGTSGTLTVRVSEVSDNDWAKDVTVDPILPAGYSITPSSRYVARINKGESQTFSFTITVPNSASLGSQVGNIKLRYSETGALDIGVFGPYENSNTFYLTIIKNSAENVPFIGSTATGYSNSYLYSFLPVLIILLIVGILVVTIAYIQNKKKSKPQLDGNSVTPTTTVQRQIIPIKQNFCSNCGTELIAENSKFCPECGENLSKNQEHPPLKKGKKKRTGILGLVVGLFLIFIGILILFYINVYPVITILGQGMTIAQMDLLCENVVVSVLSQGSCSNVHIQFLFGWIIAIILIIAGLLEAFFG
jgi:hypothetical protein